jgi:hypothetical protein
MMASGDAGQPKRQRAGALQDASAQIEDRQRKERKDRKENKGELNGARCGDRLSPPRGARIFLEVTL